MLYFIIKPLVQIWLRVFYRKVYYTNAHTLPEDRPLIFAVNHPTAFLDPIIVAAYLPHTVHFMLRGDLFKGAIKNRLLASIKTIPIFRARDGFQNLKNNQATFDRVYQHLADGKNILILAEGLCVHEKRMRPIQKGTARMVFGAFEKHGRRDIAIVPVGVNFTDAHRFRSEIMVDIGPIIELEDYMADYESNPRRGVTQLTKEISKRMKKRIVHIDNPEDEDFVEQLLTLNRNFKQEAILPALTRGHNWVWEEKHIADTINDMPDAEKQQLRHDTESYFNELEQLKVSDVSVAKPRYYNWVNSILLVLGFVPFVFGFVANAWPIIFGKWVADKKVKLIQFHASVRFAIGMVTYFIYFITLLILAISSGKIWAMILVALMPFLGYLSLQYRDLFQKWRNARHFNQLEKTVKDRLRKKRQQVSSMVAIPILKVERA